MPVPTSIDYGQIADGYDNSRRVEPAIASALANGLNRLNAHSVLEIGAGTGNYTVALSASGFAMHAIDRSSAMAARGAAKTRAPWIVADAERLPFHEQSFDAVTGVNVLHHLTDACAALTELRRVARRGLVLQAVVRENLATLWYRHYFPQIDTTLLPLHPPLGRLITSMFRAGFSRVTTATVSYSGVGDLTFEAARMRPALLFDSAFRAATSGFRRLDSSAIACGLAELERDLAIGAFEPIAAQYESSHDEAGDCVVVVAT